MDEPLSSPLLIAALDHPSLDGDVARFLEDLRAEPRYFGARSKYSSKAPTSLVRRLAVSGPVGLAAVADGRVIAVARVTDDGHLFVAVAERFRSRGIGRRLIAATMERARCAGHGRLVLTSTYRSGAIAALARELGWIVVDQGRGRIDLIIDLTQRAQSA